MTVTVAGVFDVVAFLGFVAAALLFAAVGRSGPRGSRGARILAAVALGLLALISASNVLEHMGITDRFDPAEDYLEVAVFPVLGYALYAMWASEQLEKLRLSQRHAMAEHDMLMGIIDASPMGIVVVNQRGCLAFANQPAWDALGLRGCDGPECCDAAGTVVPTGAEPPSDKVIFHTSVLGREVRGERWELVSGGKRRPLELTAVPFGSGTERASVAVFRFLDE